MHDPSRDPRLEFRDGAPVSTRFDDVYFSRAGGLAESAHVFLDGCDLPDGWDRPGGLPFTIGETGFGTGLNFLAAWEVWRARRPAGGVLHYVAVEGYPIPRPLMREALSAFPRLAPLAARLVERYPDTPSGLHRIWFEPDRVCLTLSIGEAAAALAAVEARVDAWFLDGFAPARNPDMWRGEVLREVARLSVTGTRIASFTAAGSVRRGLAAVGFEIWKRPGFGHKRDCIAGRFAGASGANTTVSAGQPPWFAAPPPVAARHVAVVGGGVGGAATVRALGRRGVAVTWLDRHGRAAAEASGNPVGLMMARPVLDAGGSGSVSPAAFRHAVEEAAGLGVAFGGDGVLELAPDPASEARFAALEEAGLLSPVGAVTVDAETAASIAGVRLGRPGLWHRSGGWVNPGDWTAALAGAVRPMRAVVGRIAADGSGWTLLDACGGVLVTADAVVVASAMTAPRLLDRAFLPLQAVRGQLTRLATTAASRRIRACLAFGGYLSPAISGSHVAGATYGFDDTAAGVWPVPVRSEDHARVLNGFPDAVSTLFGTAPSLLGGRAAVRAVTPDRQPAAGPLCDAAALAMDFAHLRKDARDESGSSPPYSPGLFALTGLGSRGLVTAPLMAELAVSQMLGEPWPVARSVAAAVHPNRFAIRALKRRRL